MKINNSELSLTQSNTQTETQVETQNESQAETHSYDSSCQVLDSSDSSKLKKVREKLHRESISVFIFY